MDQVFFRGWDGLLRTLIIGALAYPVLVVFLRVSGNRTLSKLNAFDLVVTVALGSTLATVLLNKNVALAEGVLGFALLIGLQLAVTWSSVRIGWVRRTVTGEPLLLLHDGRYLADAMRGARLTTDDVAAVVRQAGLGDLGEVRAVVLETDGSFSVLRRAGADAPLLEAVRGSRAL